MNTQNQIQNQSFFTPNELSSFLKKESYKLLQAMQKSIRHNNGVMGKESKYFFRQAVCVRQPKKDIKRIHSLCVKAFGGWAFLNASKIIGVRMKLHPNKAHGQVFYDSFDYEITYNLRKR